VAVTRPRARFALLVVGFVVLVTGRALAEPRLFELTLKDGRLPESQRLLRVQQGDDVTLRWTTDRPLTLHLHGYDLEAKLVPQTPVELRFPARATGRFPLEIHGAGTERTVGHLEVLPR
jgi:hypothetical protein